MSASFPYPTLAAQLVAAIRVKPDAALAYGIWMRVVRFSDNSMCFALALALAWPCPLVIARAGVIAQLSEPAHALRSELSRIVGAFGKRGTNAIIAHQARGVGLRLGMDPPRQGVVFCKSWDEIIAQSGTVSVIATSRSKVTCGELMCGGFERVPAAFGRARLKNRSASTLVKSLCKHSPVCTACRLLLPGAAMLLGERVDHLIAKAPGDHERAPLHFKTECIEVFDLLGLPNSFDISNGALFNRLAQARHACATNAVSVAHLLRHLATRACVTSLQRCASVTSPMLLWRELVADAARGITRDDAVARWWYTRITETATAYECSAQWTQEIVEAFAIGLDAASEQEQRLVATSLLFPLMSSREWRNLFSTDEDGERMRVAKKMRIDEEGGRIESV